MLKCTKLYKKQIARNFSKASKKSTPDFTKKQSKNFDKSKYPKTQSSNNTADKKLKSRDSILSTLKPINLNKLSAEEIMISPLFKYRQNKNATEAHRMQYQNKLKLDALENERQKQMISESNNNKDFYMYMRGREQYNKWLKHVDQIKKVDQRIGTIQHSIVRGYQLNIKDEYRDLKLIFQYPGTTKGPRPEDDPVYFTEWYKNNLSYSAVNFLSSVESINKVEIQTDYDNSIRELADYSSFLNAKGINFPINIVDKAVVDEYIASGEADEDIDDDEEGMMQQRFSDGPQTPEEIYQEHIEDMEDPQDEVDYLLQAPSEVPDYLDLPFSPFATEHPYEFQEFDDYQANWNAMTQNAKLSKLISNIDILIEKNKEVEDSEEFKNMYYTSIWGYYNLLPKKVQESPVVKSTVIALERRGYFLTLEQKQAILNRACSTTLDVTEGNLNRGYNVG